MVFFREVPYYLITKSRRLGQRGDFYKLKVKIEGEVSKLSGMVINLKDVDVALAEAQKEVTEASNVANALKLISTFLKKKLSADIVEIEISRGSNSMVLNSSGIAKKWRAYVLIQNRKVAISKKCQLFYRGKKPSFPSEPYVNVEQLIHSFQNSPSQITEIWIQNEKLQGFEIYYL